MAERRDYVALEWVKGEIDETLKQARQSLEAYVDTPDDTTRLQFSLAYIHQVFGTLQMVEFYGAALLAEEMERLNQALVDGTAPTSQENLALLMQAILQLPNYLEKLKGGQSDLPVIILPLLNDLRAARGEKLLSETALFSPDLSAARRFVGEPDVGNFRHSSVVQLLRKLRQMYQLALLGWLRHQDVDTNLEYLNKSIARLSSLSERAPMGALWQAALAFVSAIKAKRIERSPAISLILRQLDSELKRLLSDPESVASEYANEDILKNLLYYLAKIDVTGLDTVRRIHEQYHLDEALPSSEEVENRRRRLAGPDRETVGNVVSALLEELARLKDSLDLMVRSRVEESRRLSELVPGIKQMADTMAVLGLGNPRRVLSEQLDFIAQIQQTELIEDEGVLMDIAGALLYVEASLSGIAEDANFDSDNEDGLDGAQEAVVREARNGLEQVKDAIVEYIGSHWDSRKLEQVPRQLSSIRGGLVMIPLEQAAHILRYAQEYVEERLLAAKHTPEWSELDALADAIMGVEYYLERLARDGSGTNLEVLQRAAESIGKLGYKVDFADLVAAPSEPDEITSPAIVESSDLAVEAGEASGLSEEGSDDGEMPWDSLSDLALEDEELEDDFEFEMSSGDDEVKEFSLEETEADQEDSTWWVDSAEQGAADSEQASSQSDEVSESESKTSSEDDDDNLIDDDILEIFIEEAAEVMETIGEFYPKYKADAGDDRALAEFRRAFHTLKGSGRMVGADVVGETAWAIENMLNRLIEGSIERSDEMFRVTDEVIKEIPRLMTSFENKQTPDARRAEALSLIAHAIAKGEPVDWSTVDGKAGDQTQSDKIEAPEPVEIEDTEDGDEFETLPPVALVEELDNDPAQELIEVFQAELATHLDTIDQFVAQAQEPAPLEDSLQRALHTIKGSAHMASVDTVADLAQPLEQLIKDMQERGKTADASVLDLLSEGAVLLHRAASGEEDMDIHAFTDRLQQVYNRVLNTTPGQDTEDFSVMSIFLSEGMDIVLNAETVLDDWQQSGEADDQVEVLIQELHILSKAAAAVELDPVAELASGLALLFEAANDGRTTADDGYFTLARDGHESLISMMDRLAAAQSIRSDALFIERLQRRLPEYGSSEVATAEEIESNLPPVEESETGDDESTAQSAVSSMIQRDLEVEQPETAPAAVMESVRHQVEGDPELVDIFLEEANDILESIQGALEDWRQDTNNTLAVEGLQRDLHTLKGGARMAEIAPLGDLAHELEFLYEGLAQGKYSPSEGLLLLIQQCHDRLASMVADIESNLSCESAPDLVAAIAHFRKHPTEAPKPVDMSAPKAAPMPEPIDGEAETVSEPEQADGGFVVAESDFDDVDETEDVMPAVPEGLEGEVDLDILEIFIDEAEELQGELEQAIDGWQAEPSNELYADELKRVLHTVKGGARLARLTSLGDLSHNFESFVIKAQQDKTPLDAAFFRQVTAYQDQMAQGVETVQTYLRTRGSGAGFGPSVIQMAQELEQTEQTDSESSLPAVIKAEPESASSGNVLPFKRKDADQKTEKQRRAQPQETVKVNASLLEGLVNLAGETSIARSRLEQEVSDFTYTLTEMDSTIDRLREQVRRLDMETEAQILFRQERAEETNYEDFDPLEMDRYSQIQQLSRSLMEATYDLNELKSSLSDKTRDAETLLLQQSRINTELQEGLMQTRMVPFNRLVPRLRRIVRQVAGELGKNVDFIVGNAEGEVDRTVLERMISPLEHMLRNAVDHGIEPAEERSRQGKDAKGMVRLDLSREGGDVVLRLNDDGAGMDVQRIKQKAIERGLLDPNSDLNDKEILQYILEAGFSTAEKVTQISGRGVGMDVVNSEVKQLGGTMSIDSRLGEGSVFTIRLPFTVSVNRALMVSIEDDQYAIPLSSIEGIVRVTPKQLAEYYRPDAPLFEYGGGRYRLEYMGSLLHTGAAPNLNGLDMPVPLVLVKGSDEHHSMALHVDRLMGSREIVVKTLGPQFSTVPGVSGATILGDGSVVVILDLSALIRSQLAVEHQNITVLPSSTGATKPKGRSKDEPVKVMVVDDSVTVRKVTSRLLERQGMEVILAKHGADAIALLQDVVPDIMLLDIEMPYMDGFEVASRVRHDDRMKLMPIIMITSRTGSKHRERALSIGVNEYMGKPFQEGPLLESIRRLLELEG
ncbi:MAG: Hpt domain-containing protein [Saccharospirillum sp.]|nr:Hpt domain-containing protein [Saccharospirillum sp.]